MKNLHIDSLDRRILKLLLKNARTPFTEIAKICKVSGAAIHQRVNKLREDKVISGSQYNINFKALGYNTCAFLGIQVSLVSTKTHDEVFEKIKAVPEIVECHHITGKYSLLIKIYTQSNEHLKQIIVEKVQSIPEIIATETFLSLEEGFTRSLPIAD